MRRSVITGLSAALVLTSAGVGGAVSASAAPAAAPAAPAATTGVADGTYVSLKPTRLLDTRGSALGRKLNAGEVFNLKVNGRGGVPSTGVTAVVLNLTVTGPTQAGFITAYPKGAAVPNASSLNFVTGDTRANLVTVPVSSDGYVSIRNAIGQTHVIADVQGYYVGSTTTAPAGAVDYFPDDPWRVLDTRTAADGPALDPDTDVVVSIDYGLNTPDIAALAVNVTAVRPEKSGYLRAWNGDISAFPSTSNLNFAAGATTSNMVLVPVTHRLDTDGTPVIDFAVNNTSTGKVNVIVDVVGVYAKGDGLRFRSAGSPVRIVDTRTSVGTTTLGPATTRTVTAPSTVANSITVALVTNATAVKPTQATYLTLWQTGVTRSSSSNLNPAAGQTVANMAMVAVNDVNKFNIYNNSGTTNVIVDVAGRFDVSPNLGTAPPAFSAQTAPKAATSQVAPLR
ncbi:MAG TPA: hypothetical protein VFN43_03665 [Humibacillus sp.]|nr:hypothetical protein [Humibacillus sp.]